MFAEKFLNHTKDFNTCTVMILKCGAVLFATLVMCGAALMFIPPNIADSQTAELLAEELLSAGEKTLIITVLMGFISDYITGKKEK
ncbi:MAG: hypothetical protein LBS74_09845 [Oscillospiraceae bacterium]|jgi:hypothetical protein|nr:hypothetical protein [Oscillospiraceae bacterium]